MQDLDDAAGASTSAGYDHLLMLDVIEHLKRPRAVPEQLRAQFDYRPQTLVLTTPNVAFVVQRLMLLLGQFNYGKPGSSTARTRACSPSEPRRLLRRRGLPAQEVRGVPAPFPKVLGDGAARPRRRGRTRR